jgi:hypothetical protein
MPVLLLIPIAVIAFIYRSDFGGKWLMLYAVFLAGAAVVVFALELPPIIFHVVQCVTAVVMLIHVQANPKIPWR